MTPHPASDSPTQPTAPVGRLAPTPSGMLHVGNGRSFLAAWLAARASGGKVILRIEDIDRDRCKPELEAEQIRDLKWLGLDWDEGPDVGGPTGPYRQSERLAQYHDALTTLRNAGRAFACVCTRKEVQLAASAPHEGDEQFYPGTCRGKYRDAEHAQSETGRTAAWRLRTDPGQTSFTDRVLGPVTTDTHQIVGDFVVMRRDGWPAYQLAVVVDDIAMGVTQVVRGHDLLASTARQLLLRELLGDTRQVEWAHLPLAVDAGGQRLAKRSDSLSLRSLRDSGVPAERVIGVLGHSLGLTESPTPVQARELLAHFSWDRIPRDPWPVVSI